MLFIAKSYYIIHMKNYLQIFPSLVDVVPEARLNLVIYYLQNNDIKEAYKLLKDMQPAVPQEYILKGVVNAALGQELNSVGIPLFNALLINSIY